jgi:L-lactate dehydrogenase complex protein LldE
LKNVKGLEFVEMLNADVCCGFGGTFSVKFPEISAGILDNKIEFIEKANIDTLVSGDASCLMQISGRLSRLGSKIKTMHLAEVLAMQN